MAQVANNADDYTNGRLNIFFPANSSPPSGNDGDLTGQCVTLVKWFMAEMTGVPNPFAARGDARYLGHTLVAQGLAVEVPYANRQRGDVICLEFGTYGHTYIQLSGGRVFEENVNWAGVKSRVVAGGTVYASRIGSDSEAWRASLNPHAYRLKSYSEKGAMTMPSPAEVKSAFQQYNIGTPSADQVTYYSTRTWDVLLNDLLAFVWGNYTMLPDAVDYAFKLGMNRPATNDEKGYWQHRSPSEFLAAVYGTRTTGPTDAGSYIPYNGAPLFTKK